MNNLLDITNISGVEFSSALIVLNIVLAFALSMVIAWVYQKTHRGISYSQSYVISLVMMTVLAAIAMMILGNNLVRALGVLGIFALIRFRTIIKDTKDVTFLFFGLAVGMAVGTSNYLIAFIGSAMLSAIILILDKYNFGSVVKEGFLVTLVTDQNFSQDSYENVFEKNLKSHRILQIKSRPGGEKEYYFSIRFKNEDFPGGFINELQSLPGVKFVDLITGKDAAEY